MGANYDTAIGFGKTARDAFEQVADQSTYEDGHSYSGSIGMKESAVMVGTLPARVTFRTFDKVASRFEDWQRDRAWFDYVTPAATDETPYPQGRSVKRRRDPRPNALRSAEATRMLERWIEVAHGDKWGPAAGVELNVQESKAMKGATDRKGSRARVFAFGGYCSS